MDRLVECKTAMEVNISPNEQLMIKMTWLIQWKSNGEKGVYSKQRGRSEVEIEEEMTSRALHLTGLGIEPPTVRLALNLSLVSLFLSFTTYHTLTNTMTSYLSASEAFSRERLPADTPNLPAQAPWATKYRGVSLGDIIKNCLLTMYRPPWKT